MTKLLRILGKRGRITIPFEIRRAVGFRYNDVLSFTQSDSNTVIVRREVLCDENCPYHDTELLDSDPMSVTEFLDSLTEEEQREALVYLSACWASKQGGNIHA